MWFVSKEVPEGISHNFCNSNLKWLINGASTETKNGTVGITTHECYEYSSWANV